MDQIFLTDHNALVKSKDTQPQNVPVDMPWITSGGHVTIYLPMHTIQRS